MACIHGRSCCPSCHPERTFRRYEKQARERNLEFRITLEQFRTIVQEPCFYCGEFGDPRGLDRRRNEFPYTADNVCACCARCNRAKSDLSEFDFLAHAKKITEHQEVLRQRTEQIQKQTEQVKASPPQQEVKPDPTLKIYRPDLPEAARRYLDRGW
jgi:hypothetical protein